MSNIASLVSEAGSPVPSGRGGCHSAKEHGTLFPDSKYKDLTVGEMRIMEKNGNGKEDDACSVATEAALSVMSENCNDGDGKINNALQASRIAIDYLSKQGKIVFVREVQGIKKIDDDLWEVEISSTSDRSFNGKLRVSSEKVEIVEEGE
jgi:hypothetical protein